MLMCFLCNSPYRNNIFRFGVFFSGIFRKICFFQARRFKPTILTSAIAHSTWRQPLRTCPGWQPRCCTIPLKDAPCPRNWQWNAPCWHHPHRFVLAKPQEVGSPCQYTSAYVGCRGWYMMIACCWVTAKFLNQSLQHCGMEVGMACISQIHRIRFIRPPNTINETLQYLVLGWKWPPAFPETTIL